MPDISNKDQTHPALEDNPSQTNDDLNELRKHLLGPVQALVERLRERLDNPEIYAETVSRVLPEAIKLRQKQDSQVARALEPAIEETVKSSMHKDRRPYLDTLFPILGPTLRSVIRSPFVWSAIILLLGAIGFRAYEIYQNYNTRQLYYDRLRAEPGIVITGIERRAGQNHVFGFRDSLSSDPVKLLSQKDLDPHEITFHWEPYYSLHPKFIAKRVNAVLEPPQTVKLEIRNGILEVRGAAFSEWINVARRLARAVPGISEYRDDKLVDIEKAMRPPATVTLELKGSLLAASGYAFGKWISVARKQAGAIPGISAYQDDNVIDIDINDKLKPPATITLQLKEGVLIARGAAFGSWITKARKLSVVIPGISEYRDEGVVDIAKVLKPPATVKLDLKERVLLARGPALPDWISAARKQAKTIPGISNYRDEGVIDIAKVLKLPSTVTLELNKRILSASGSAFPKWIISARERVRTIAGLNAYQDKKVIDIYRVLKPPAGVTLKLKDRIIIAQGAALPEWVVSARESAKALHGISGYKDDQVLDININERLKPPATVTIELKDGALMAHGSAFGDWISAARKSAEAIPGILEYKDDRVINIQEALRPPVTIKLKVIDRDLIAEGSALPAWITSARKRVRSIPAIRNYRDDKVVNIQQFLKPPGTISFELRDKSLVVHGSAFSDWIKTSRKLATTIPGISNYLDAKVVDIEQALRPPATVKLELENRNLIAVGSALPKWITSARELARAIPGIEVYNGRGMIDIQKELNPPDTITLTLMDKDLHAQGSASQKWISATRQRVKSMPLISKFHEDIIVLSDPVKEMELVTKKIEKQYLFFNSSQARIAPNQDNTIANLIRDFSSLFDLAQVLEKRVRIEVTGHTDTTGSYWGNLRLGKKRANNFVNLIVSKGFDRKHFTVAPIDPKKPLRNELNENDKRLNRSVSFTVKLFAGLGST